MRYKLWRLSTEFYGVGQKGSDGSVSLWSMLWSPKPLRGKANLARSFSGGIGGGRGGILSLSSLVGELVVLLPSLESLPEWLPPLESLPEWLPSLLEWLPPLQLAGGWNRTL